MYKIKRCSPVWWLLRGTYGIDKIGDGDCSKYRYGKISAFLYWNHKIRHLEVM